MKGRIGPRDLVATLREALGHEWQQEYDSRGHFVQATAPLGRTTLVPVRPDRRAAGADRRAGRSSLGCGLQGLG
ncbi:hypothetical protein ACFPFG_33410 [Delftia deserti]|uniref:Uncharacterized protein n=1 Tax=Delftia deserti TaxID=1651218 RepID=A0ABW5EM14_9BURK